jgi:uncharacterized membrane protein YdfJ with MMPL/SSD domain
MDGLDRLLARRRWVVLVAWVALVAAALPFAARQSERLTSGGFTVPGSGSEAVDEALSGFEGVESDELAAVIARRDGDAGDVRDELGRVEAAVERVDHVAVEDTALREARSGAGRRDVTVLPLAVSGEQDQAADAAVDLRSELGLGDGGGAGGAETHLVGQQALWAGMQDLSREDLSSAERTGFPVVFLILLAVFGSLVAAALPLSLGFAAVTVTGAVIHFASREMQMSVFVTNVASMIGIAVAVDYSLFVLARYRQEIRAGLAPGEARRVALRTSGLAVVFSGLTVVISLAALFMVPSQTIRSMAVGAITVVVFAVLAAVTLLPLLIGLFGRRAHERGRSARALAAARGALGRLRPAGGAGARERAGSEDFWERWVDRVMRRPLVAALLTGGLLLLVTAPTLDLELGDGALAQFPEGHETRVGAELAARTTSPGAMGPVRIVARFDSGRYDEAANRRPVDAYLAALGRDPAVVRTEGPLPAEDGRSVLLTAVPRSQPESDDARELVERLREAGGAAEDLEQVASLDVGGSTAQLEDFRSLIAGSMWKILVFVLAFSYVALLVLLRSVFLPLKAVAMNLLTVGTAYGVLVVVFQWGWFDGFLGFESLGYVNAMTPPLLLAVVFGISMDYEVFLLSRIRERYDATGDTRIAVGQGLRASARTISSAALIMVCVFAIFAGTGVPSIKEIGLGLAVAIAVDATLVRLVLVPSVMQLMGRWNWWLPGRLARVLPRTDFEASGRAHEAPA